MLVVEDDDDGRELVRRLLADRHAEVTAVASGAEALTVLESLRPEVLISDIGMSGMDGYRFMLEVRRREEARGQAAVPALALTAYGATVDIARAGAVGYQLHLAKPFDAQRLLLAVAELAGRTVPEGP